MTPVSHLAVPATLAAIDETRTWAVGHARAAGFDEDALAELELAMTEALANVVKHGYGGREEGRIDLEIRIEDERLELRIHDRAPVFEASEVPVRDLDHVSEGGYGLSLIGLLMDDVERVPRPGGGNTLILVKLRRGSTHG